MRMVLRALRKRVDGDAAALAMIDDVRGARDSMHRLLRGLLDLASAETGALRPAPRPTALGPLLTRLGRELGPLAEAKGLRLVVIPTSAMAVTDPDLLERILRNLLSNAVRYTERGGILLGCRRRGATGLSLEVWDTGVGIAEGDRERVFEEFAQLASPTRDRSEGIGLGLAIADRLARMLGHGLELGSRPGHGSVFRVTMTAAAGAGLPRREALAPR
jgi:signal transduction histidine kinase